MSDIEEKVKSIIDERAERGASKYGVTMERDDLTVREWIRHTQEELLDATIYLEKILEENHTFPIDKPRGIIEWYRCLDAWIEHIEMPECYPTDKVFTFWRENDETFPCVCEEKGFGTPKTMPKDYNVCIACNCEVIA